MPRAGAIQNAGRLIVIVMGSLLMLAALLSQLR